jgi:hypothetical protein
MLWLGEPRQDYHNCRKQAILLIENWPTLSVTVVAMLQQLSRFPIWVMRETALSSTSIRRPLFFSCNAVLGGRDLYIAPRALKQS